MKNANGWTDGHKPP